jgi:ATP-dependent RNA helicase RhlE
MFVMRSDKRGLLTYIIEEEQPDKVLVFSRTKHGCNRIVRQLGQDGIEALPIHGNKSQGARENALRRFRNGTLQVLVATDVASRGIDVSDISHVINLDLPNEPEVYVHRIGRTGRAGQGGITIAFCDENEGEYLRGIEKMIRQDIPVDEDHPFHSEKARSRKGNKAPRSSRIGAVAGASLAMANPLATARMGNQISNPTATARMGNQISNPTVDAIAGVQAAAEDANNASSRPVTELARTQRLAR